MNRAHSMLAKVTPLILTFNEAPNIGRVLQKLTWAPRIVVIDSFSSDETLEILRSYPQVEIFQRSFDSHANQVQTEWVLSLDADYVLTDELISEIDALSFDTLVNGFSIRFKYCVFGEPLRGAILPPRQALFRREQATYIDDGHTQLLQVQGVSSALNQYILHDDRKPLNRWLWAQDRYMVLEVKKLLGTAREDLTLGDRVRKTKLLAPPIIFFYCLLLKGGIFSGWAGWYYAFQRLLAEVLLSIHLIAAERTAKNLGN
jgi:glycosyltransferase involved in cell wall biosynthesis